MGCAAEQCRKLSRDVDPDEDKKLVEFGKPVLTQTFKLELDPSSETGFRNLPSEMMEVWIDQGFSKEEIQKFSAQIIESRNRMELEKNNIQQSMQSQQEIAELIEKAKKNVTDDIIVQEIFPKFIELGEGNQASIYFAQYSDKGPKENQYVAIQVQRMDTDGLDQMYFDTGVLQILKHPNIVNYIQTYTEFNSKQLQHKFYTVFEVMECGTLTEYMDFVKEMDSEYDSLENENQMINQTGRESLDEQEERKTNFVKQSEEILKNRKEFQSLKHQSIAYILREVLLGLDFIHKNYFIHRDIKSNNILINSQGEVKIGDFGFIGAITVEQNKLRQKVGTTHWMAPEIILKLNYDQKVDIYSLGIVAIQLAELVLPGYDLRQSQIERNVKRSKLPKLQRPDLFPPDFVDLVEACLQRDPANRPNCEKLLQSRYIQEALAYQSDFKQFIEPFVQKGLEFIQSLKENLNQ